MKCLLDVVRKECGHGYIPIREFYIDAFMYCRRNSVSLSMAFSSVKISKESYRTYWKSRR